MRPLWFLSLLSQCSNFERKSLMERMTFVRSRGWYHNCLVLGHRQVHVQSWDSAGLLVAMEIIPVSCIQKCQGSPKHKSRQLLTLHCRHEMVKKEAASRYIKGRNNSFKEGKCNEPYLFTNKPINFCTKLNWKPVKSLQDRKFGLWPNIFAKKSNAAKALIECLDSAVSREIINSTNYR